MPGRSRCAVVGAGSRARLYVGAMTGEHADVAELVAVCDVNPGRARLHADRAAAAGAPAPTCHHPDDLERMIAERGVDRVVVTSPDVTHADVAARALRAGADVVVEKPLTIDEAGCRTVATAVAETGREVVVTFNYRYAPRNAALRELVASGAVGDVTSVHFEWLLDTRHGADYFRRWHRDKASSGGLLVHKASHHFDLVNWWIDDAPTRVYARGGLRFYGAENARRRGVAHGRRDDPAAAQDPFALDLRADPELRELYLDHEGHDGYLRDQDVFGEGITIEDTLSLVVDHARGSTMTYSLTAHAPWEGYVVAVNGTRGRAELTVVERGAVAAGDVLDASAAGAGDRGAGLRPVSERLLLQQHWQPAREVAIPADAGAHGGGDARLLRDVFRGPGEDPLRRAADHVDGLRSLAVGIAGNASLASGLPVDTADLDLGLPVRGARAGSGRPGPRD
ncbi:Gfo/Idh/MocA family oxidoreductase [Kineococcus sp. R8]|uniref:Gfo/Idh/MocA family protein n=1 Tax=Kineococcus siccus TaxID=2696567 RepID=UPI0014132D7C|nr:Gfo/Idh/MocA family oxidoreductase [Kineococcus siccus]NAZ83998.1 Gfo/Idh/MocA family oxidoreductase [Kineococcus siccus]